MSNTIFLLAVVLIIATFQPVYYAAHKPGIFLAMILAVMFDLIYFLFFRRRP